MENMLRRNLPLLDLHQVQSFFSTSVVDFSSQYGSAEDANQGSYCVTNIIGSPTIFPEYGDHTNSCVFREYNTWWKTSPMAKARVKFPEDHLLTADEYVDLEFGVALILKSVRVYETYNPGTIVCIRGLFYESHESVVWKTLWKAENGPTVEPHSSRIFEPPVKQIALPLVYLRLELNCSLCNYYTELDAVEVLGIAASEYSLTLPLPDPWNMNKFTEQFASINIMQNMYVENSRESSGGFDLLPDNLLFDICDNLNIVDLCKLAQVSKFFHWLVREYFCRSLQHLNLSFAWPAIQDLHLFCFQKILRNSRQLKSINMSWCGTYNSISTNGFQYFLTNSYFSKSLTTFELANCQFMNDDSLLLIIQMCPNIQELNLASVRQLTNRSLEQLGRLKKLTWINLYRTHCSGRCLKSLATNCNQLAFLNIGSCKGLITVDDIFQEWIHHNPLSLRGLDLWRLPITPVTLQLFSEHFFNLEELDLGWCRGVDNCETGDLLRVISKCTKLKKLFLTAFRSVTDREIFAMAHYLTDLEQVDILGTRNVTTEAILHLLQSCGKLRMFDLSFCDIEKVDIDSMKMQYPHCAILNSFIT